MTDQSGKPDEEGELEDDLLVDEPAAVREELRRKIKTEGVRVAYDALIAVARDPRAMASARSASSIALFRAGGFLSRKAEEEADADEKPIENLTDAEMQAEIRRLRARRQQLQSKRSRSEDDDGEGGIFGE